MKQRINSLLTNKDQFIDFFILSNISDYANEIKQLNDKEKLILIKNFIETEIDELIVNVANENIFNFINLMDEKYYIEMVEFIKNYKIENIEDINKLIVFVNYKPMDNEIKESIFNKICENIDILLNGYKDCLYFESIIKFVYNYNSDCLLKYLRKHKNVVIEKSKLFLNMYNVDDLNIKDYDELI